MCMSATCGQCSKKTWRGCGSHIPSAMSGVPETEWCTCTPKVEVGGKEYPPAAKMGVPGFLKGWIGGSDEGKKDAKKDEL